MGTGQMLLTIGTMTIFSFLILRLNMANLSTEDEMMNGKFGILAISIASSVMEDACSKAFDNATDENAYNSTSYLTAHNLLGSESGETYDTFNDFDDFNNFSRIDSTLPSARFKVTANVLYVNPSSPDVAASTRTWHKKIVVAVTSPNMKDTVRLTQVFSYWAFR